MPGQECFIIEDGAHSFRSRRPTAATASTSPGQLLQRETPGVHSGNPGARSTSRQVGSPPMPARAPRGRFGSSVTGNRAVGKSPCTINSVLARWRFERGRTGTKEGQRKKNSPRSDIARLLPVLTSSAEEFSSRKETAAIFPTAWTASPYEQNLPDRGLVHDARIAQPIMITDHDERS